MFKITTILHLITLLLFGVSPSYYTSYSFNQPEIISYHRPPIKSSLVHIYQRIKSEAGLISSHLISLLHSLLFVISKIKIKIVEENAFVIHE